MIEFYNNAPFHFLNSGHCCFSRTDYLHLIAITDCDASRQLRQLFFQIVKEPLSLSVENRLLASSFSSTKLLDYAFIARLLKAKPSIVFTLINSVIFQRFCINYYLYIFYYLYTLYIKFFQMSNYFLHFLKIFLYIYLYFSWYINNLHLKFEMNCKTMKKFLQVIFDIFLINFNYHHNRKI